MLEKDIFKRCNPCYDKLLSYGFKYNGDNKYIFEKLIIDDTFLIKIFVDNSSVVGKVVDLDAECEYTNFRIENNGVFAGKVRNKFEELLIDIRDNCFEKKLFISNQANRIGLLIKEKYGDFPYYEWESTPDTGVFKNAITNKWYAIIMNVKRSKLSVGDDLVDVLNVKIDPSKIVELLNFIGYYPAYHMNKKYWISIILDESISDGDILNLIDESYFYSSIKK